MTEYLTIAPKLLLPLFHLLIIHKYMKIFGKPAQQNIISYIEWGIYYIFLSINNVGIHLPPHLLLFGNVLLIFIISSSTRKNSVMHQCIFSVLICTVWMLVEVIVIMILSTVGFDKGTLKDAGSFVSKMCMLLLSGTIIIQKSLCFTFWLFFLSQPAVFILCTIYSLLLLPIVNMQFFQLQPVFYCLL